MASFAPYSYIQCPCSDSSISQRQPAEELDTAPSQDEAPDEDEDDHTFDPRAPRSNYSLYPLEYLLYCDVCHQIRCPRCVAEEIVTIYCPNCLFEAETTALKSERTRCTRSCFQCPICIGPLAVTSLDAAPESSLLSADNANPSTSQSGPFALTCSYCNWSSAESGIQFDKPSGIYTQLNKLRNPDGDKEHKPTYSGDESTAFPASSRSSDPVVPDTVKARFGALKSFYQSQLAEANGGVGNVADGYGYGSPGALSRIMSLYSTNTSSVLKAKSSKPSTMMREVESPSEGQRMGHLDDSAGIAQLRRDGWDGTVTRDQASAQVEGGSRFADQLWPIPYQLRTKRSKRCPVCRHIISKPESKINNTRWRIRLVANNYIPSISIRPLNGNSAAAPSSSSIPATPATPSFATLGPLAAGQASPLSPLQPVQYLLTFKNPLFESIRVTLATPAVTPGRFASKVTVLCPEFTVGANADTEMYLDDVLKDGDGERRKKDEDGGQQMGGAGKVWERGRNWVSVVVEVVPASLKLEPKPALLRKEGEPEEDLSPLKEDEDILEIPMFVRLEWESEPSQDQVGISTTSSKDKDAKEKRELAYWCALGIGRISQE